MVLESQVNTDILVIRRHRIQTDNVILRLLHHRPPFQVASLKCDDGDHCPPEICVRPRLHFPYKAVRSDISRERVEAKAAFLLGGKHGEADVVVEIAFAHV